MMAVLHYDFLPVSCRALPKQSYPFASSLASEEKAWSRGSLGALGDFLMAQGEAVRRWDPSSSTGALDLNALISDDDAAISDLFGPQYTFSGL